MEQELQTQAEELARIAVMHAQQHFNLRLDYSNTSIEAVESLLSTLHEQIPHTRLARVFKPKPDFNYVARIANAYGAYVGEVIRRELGGEWEEVEICGCEHVLMLRIAGDFTLLPTTKTWNRLTMGPSENVLEYFKRAMQRAGSRRSTSGKREVSATASC